MKSGVLSSFLFIWVGLCLSEVLPNGVWSEWGYAQWGFVRLPSPPKEQVNCQMQNLWTYIGKILKMTMHSK